MGFLRSNFTMSLGRRPLIKVTPAPSLPLLPFNSRLVYEGDSEFATSSSVQTYPGLIVPLAGGRFRLPIGWNQASGGQTTSQMVTQLDSVNTKLPDVVVLLAGTNDDKSSDTARDTIISNLQQMVAGYLTGGAKYVVIGTILPRFAEGAITAAAETRRLFINNAIRLMASASVKVVDLETLPLSAADFIDGLHPNQLGQQKVSNAFATVLKSISEAVDPLELWDTAPNVLYSRGKDPSFTSGGGIIDNTGTGTINGISSPQASAIADNGIPLGWLVTNPTPLALTVSRVPMEDGTSGCRIQGSGTVTVAGQRIQLRATLTRSPAAVAGQINEQWVGFNQAADMRGIGNIGMMSTSTIDWSPGRSINTGVAGVDAGTGLPAITGGVLRTAQNQAYATTGLTSFTQYIELLTVPGTVSFDVTFYKPYSALVTAG